VYQLMPRKIERLRERRDLGLRDLRPRVAEHLLDELRVAASEDRVEVELVEVRMPACGCRAVLGGVGRRMMRREVHDEPDLRRARRALAEAPHRRSVRTEESMRDTSRFREVAMAGGVHAVHVARVHDDHGSFNVHHIGTRSPSRS
jgi:hypothetical protein